MEEKLKFKNVIALAVQLLFAVFCFTMSIINIDADIKASGHPTGHDDFIIAIVSIALILYSFLTFNKPHSNMFKYTLILLGFGIGCVALTTYGSEMNLGICVGIMLFVASFMICYVAGCLHKRLRVNIVISFAFALTLASEIIFCTQRGFMPDFQFSFTLLLASAILSYNVRYSEHKEAGIEADKIAKEQADAEQNAADDNGSQN